MPSTVVATPATDINESDSKQIPLLSRNFESLTNIDEIRECLRLLDEEETRIDVSLDDMLAEETSLEQSLNTLNALRLETYISEYEHVELTLYIDLN